MNGGFANRREKFFQGTHADTANDLAIQSALSILRAEIEGVARANGLSSIADGVMERMLSSAQQDLRAMQPGQLKGFSTSHPLVQRIALDSFGKVFSGYSPDQMKALAQGTLKGGSEASTGTGALGSERHAGLAAVSARGAVGGRYRDALDGASNGIGTAASLPGSYAKAFSGLGYDAATVNTFAEVGLNRRLFDRLQREGYDKEEIARGAKSAKRLGWHGEKDNAALVHIGEDGQKLTEQTQQHIDQGNMDAARAGIEEMKRRRDSTTDSKERDGYDHVIDKITRGHKELKSEVGLEAVRNTSEADRAVMHAEAGSETARKNTDAAIAATDKKSDAAADAALMADLGMSDAKPTDKSTKAADATPTAGEPAKATVVAEAKPSQPAKPTAAAPKMGA